MPVKSFYRHKRLKSIESKREALEGKIEGLEKVKKMY